MTGKRILIVETDRVAARELSRAMEERGHTVALAHSGAEAINKSQEQSFDACYLSLTLSDMTGLECTMRLRQLPPTAARYIIMTNFCDNEVLFAAADAGVHRVLFQPFALEEFVGCSEALPA